MDGAAKVLETLRSIKTFAQITHRVMTTVDPRVDVKLTFFSDSLMITAVPVQDGEVASDSTLLAAVVGHVASVIVSGLEGELHLTYRGCIALGEFAAVDEFFVGPAIDEAAQWADTANMAAVWLRPSAAEATPPPTQRTCFTLIGSSR
ncbi:MAG: hypothetical protein WDO74_06660 [Pseudomonadota bacterium]